MITCHHCCHCAVEAVSETSGWEQMLPTVVGTLLGGAISVILAVSLFRAGRTKDAETQERQENKTAENRRIEASRSWYVNVLVNPNLPKIEVFFKALNESLIDTVSVLIECKSGSVNDYKSVKAKKIAEFKRKLLEFDLEVIELLRSNKPELGEELLTWTLGVEDIVGKFIDSIFESDDIDSDDLKRRLAAVKAEFYKITYKPIQTESK